MQSCKLSMRAQSRSLLKEMPCSRSFFYVDRFRQCVLTSEAASTDNELLKSLQNLFAFLALSQVRLDVSLEGLNLFSSDLVTARRSSGSKLNPLTSNGINSKIAKNFSDISWTPFTKTRNEAHGPSTLSVRLRTLLLTGSR